MLASCLTRWFFSNQRRFSEQTRDTFLDKFPIIIFQHTCLQRSSFLYHTQVLHQQLCPKLLIGCERYSTRSCLIGTPSTHTHTHTVHNVPSSLVFSTWPLSSWPLSSWPLSSWNAVTSLGFGFSSGSLDSERGWVSFSSRRVTFCSVGVCSSGCVSFCSISPGGTGVGCCWVVISLSVDFNCGRRRRTQTDILTTTHTVFKNTVCLRWNWCEWKFICY